MLKVGDILWTFYEDSYFIGEISSIYLFNIGNDTYSFINTNGIIGENQRLLIPAIANFNTLVKVQNYSVTIYHTISESVATNYIREHYN